MGDEEVVTGVPVAVPGDIEQEVISTVVRLGGLETGVRGPLAKLAIRLARTLDALPLNAPPTTVARLSQELRTTILALTGVNTNDGSGIKQLFALMQTPLRNAEDIRPEDSGTLRSEDGPAAG